MVFAGRKGGNGAIGIGIAIATAMRASRE